MAAPDPSWMARWGAEPLGTWQRWSHPRWRGGIQSLGHVVASEPSLSRVVGSVAVVAHGSAWTHTLPFFLGLKHVRGVPGIQGTDSGP
jgi:hypothetical protein